MSRVFLGGEVGWVAEATGTVTAVGGTVSRVFFSWLGRSCLTLMVKSDVVAASCGGWGGSGGR